MAKTATSALPSDQLMVVFDQDLNRIVPYLETLLPKGMFERFKQMARLAVLRNRKLLECSPISLLKALIWCAQKNMEPGVEDGVWLIPFQGKVVPVPAYKGLINKAVEVGAVLSVDPRPVYVNDEFFYCYGLMPDLKHVPPDLGKDRGALLIGAYVIFTLPNGEKKFHVMDRPAIEKIRNSSAAWKAGQSGPWKDWEEAMFLKTVIKQGLKTIPMRADLRDLLAEEGLIEIGASVGAILTQSGTELPGVLEDEEPEGQKKVEPDTSAFDRLVVVELANLTSTEARLRVAHLEENLKLVAKTTKKKVPEFKLYVMDFPGGRFHPYTNPQGEAKEGYWKTFLAWEAHPDRPWNKGVVMDAEGAGPGAETPVAEDDQVASIIFEERKKVLVAKILEKLIPLADLGLTKLEEIIHLNIEDVEKRVEAWVPPKK